jgi:hypothetical protein
MFRTEETKDLIRSFMTTHCIGKASCLLPSELLARMITDFTCECRERVGRHKVMSKLMVVYHCSGRELEVPFGMAQLLGGEEEAIGSELMLQLVAYVDLACSLILIYTMAKLKAISKQRLDEISSSLVELKDFAI